MPPSAPMTHRQRMLAVLEHRQPDRIPWFPRLEIWHEANRRAGTLPARYQGVPLRDIYHRLDMGLQGRDMVKRRIFRTELRGVEMRQEETPDALRTTHVTPVGSVSTLERQSEDLQRKGIMALEVEHLIKGPEDYAPVEYLIQHTEIIPCYADYLAYEVEIGEDGVPFTYLGHDPMNRILQELIGYNQAFYHLADYPEQVEHLYRVLLEQADEIQRVALASPAKLVLHGQHFDSKMTPSRLFRKYMVPYYRAFADQLHARGKLLACHADADTSRLMGDVLEAGFDVLDCFVTAPMVPVTIPQARAVFGDKVILWGGIPSVLLEETTTDAEFDRYMFDLFRAVAPGDAFILGIADNAMPESYIERIERVSQMIAAYGQYPIDLTRLPKG